MSAVVRYDAQSNLMVAGRDANAAAKVGFPLSAKGGGKEKE